MSGYNSLKSFDGRWNELFGAFLKLIVSVVIFFTFIFLDGTRVENKGKLILTEIFPSVQKHDI